jgi:hypothetical protein
MIDAIRARNKPHVGFCGTLDDWACTKCGYTNFRNRVSVQNVFYGKTPMEKPQHARDVHTWRAVFFVTHTHHPYSDGLASPLFIRLR